MHKSVFFCSKNSQGFPRSTTEEQCCALLPE